MTTLPPCTTTATGFGPCVTPGSPDLSSEAATDDHLASIARSLGHPARVAIVKELSGSQPRAAGDIAADSGLARSTVSEHLKILRKAGLVCACQDGASVRYRLRYSAVRAFVRDLEQLATESRELVT